ncbi:MAG: helix-turn-helix domain-containing protein [Thermodesulfobacteriota bacterium]
MDPNKSSDVDNDFQFEIMTPEEVAQYLHKSLGWVYKNWQLLGGRKLGGSLFFPNKEDLYERIFQKGEGVEIRFHSQPNQVHKRLVQNKSRGQNGRGKKKGGNSKPEAGEGDSNRHGILGSGQQTVGSCESL